MDDPRQRGHDARLAMKERSSNPFGEGDPRFDEWNAGFDAADAEAGAAPLDGSDE